MTTDIKQKISHGIGLDSGSEQVIRRLEKEGAIKRQHETIYQFIKAYKHNAGTLYKHLR